MERGDTTSRKLVRAVRPHIPTPRHCSTQARSVVCRATVVKMASLKAIVLFGAVLVAVFSVGSCLKCYKGRTDGVKLAKDMRPQNCTNKNEVCVRIAYKMYDVDVIIRDCMSPEHGSEKLETAREELKHRDTFPSLQSLLTCKKDACNSAKWIEISWVLLLVATTSAVLAGFR